MTAAEDLNLVVEVTDSLTGIAKQDWNELQLQGNPFVQYEFLAALESTGCIGKDTGWYPRYFLLKAVSRKALEETTAIEPPDAAPDGGDADAKSDDDNDNDNDDTRQTITEETATKEAAANKAALAEGKLLGVCPCYIKTHSYGEFVFDWAWADAYERHGMAYYPKMISAIPFTPATGPRLLMREDLPAAAAAGKKHSRNKKSEESKHSNDSITSDDVASLLIETILEYARNEKFSSMHWLFTEEPQHKILLQHGLMSRLDCQYHWRNNDYTSFDDFLAQCNSKRRKTIRRERRYVTDANLRLERRLGSTLSAHEWSLVHQYYCATFDRKWGSPSLTLEFFEKIGREFGDNCLIVLAYSEGDDPIAASIMFFGEDTLYGRFWGASEDHHCLHFEACYYQGIEFCIENKIQNFEPGAQGEHKITRGFEPTLTRSAHWIGNEGFSEAVERYLREERKLIEERREGLNERLPFKLEV